MSYTDARNQAAFDAAKSTLDDLLARYDPGQPTVILLPGGMGSQLDRSNQPYAGNPLSFSDFGVIWIGDGIIFNQDALKLEIDAQGEDDGQFIVVPDGPLRFPTLAAYAGTERFFADNSWNYAALGFDWRRSVQDAGVILDFFLSSLQSAVMARGQSDPLPRTSLLCHSQGGLVAKLYLHFPNSLGAQLQSIITVATPFYGTGTHMQRYFIGDPTLNLLYAPADVARITGGLPGPYVLMPMDHETWQARGTQLGVATYPVRGADGTPADPYDRANLGTRYPTWVDGDLLEEARLTRMAMDKDLPTDLVAKVFHLRSDHTATMAYFTWAELPGSFDPASLVSPIQPDNGRPDLGLTMGDGTVPAFSARLAQSAADHILTVPTTQTHQDLAENARFLEAIKIILDTGAMPAVTQLTALDETYSQPATAPPIAVRQLLQDAGAGKVAKDDSRLAGADIQRGILREFLT